MALPELGERVRGSLKDLWVSVEEKHGERLEYLKTARDRVNVVAGEAGKGPSRVGEALVALVETRLSVGVVNRLGQTVVATFPSLHFRSDEDLRGIIITREELEDGKVVTSIVPQEELPDVVRELKEAV